ncbi:ribonuclease PH [Dethiobacter alkaliphilus]|uniref:Ribonuclease PH n=1 Tax=Dethiobacter alkaliphilus AHT 1 TaxID=555088 RepID=C0GEZ9_DETAL|nr:ribonuclease PH [Dethiobacter alkaliphilus]EEG78181.1 ribonuclease PH [Dethiobacter alkaliphilus AHT 1]MCW3491388.1 ribonuclease PH [Dethiobacter alkaliphilus]
MRVDGRRTDEMRPLKITPEFLKYPEGSVLIEVGDTRVICTASVEEKVPPFLRGENKGWVTAEYAMLPRATQIRTMRERGKISGRSSEIQRLIGRALRSVVDLKALGERTVWVDCDVVQADGGTRTAAISGSFVALYLALSKLVAAGTLSEVPVTDYLAATSIGIVDDKLMLDLAFSEDSKADVDMNVVMTGSGNIVEVQGTAEGAAFSRQAMDEMMDLAAKGIDEIVDYQKRLLLGGLK